MAEGGHSAQTSRQVEERTIIRMKLQLKGRRFDTTEEIHTESQEVIYTLIFEDFQGCIKSWKQAGITVYMPKGTTL